jgi:hypothetical protein
MRFIITLILTVSAACGYTVNGTTFTTNGSAPDVQAAINAAGSGAVVTIPAGSFNWGTAVGTVLISGKGITLSGAGSSSTTINAQGPNGSFSGVLQIQTIGAASTRITGIAFAGGWTVGVGGSPTGATYRIDNCSFDGTNSPVNPTMLSLFGDGPGLIDHCTFTAGGAAEMIHNNGVGAGNNAGWLDDINPGSAQLVYIENCTFICNGSAFFNTGVSGAYGCRTCVRHSTFNFSKFDQHGNSGTIGNIGTRWFEFYSNVFNVPADQNQSTFADLRDGSGVVFNITVSGGPNLGTGSIELTNDFAGSTSYPIIYQIGRGLGQNSSPVYVWGMGSLASNVVSLSSYIEAGRDCFLSSAQPANMVICERASDGRGTTYNYVPFTYPYPLNSNGIPTPGQAGQGPSAPSNLRVLAVQ